VVEAVLDDFIGYVIKNCVKSNALTFNVLGTVPYSASECITAFNSVRGPPAIPLRSEGSCGAAFETFVTDLQDRASNFALFTGSDGCTLASNLVQSYTTDTVQMSYNCWFRLFGPVFSSGTTLPSPFYTFSETNGAGYSLAQCNQAYASLLGDQMFYWNAVRSILSDINFAAYKVCDDFPADCNGIGAGASYIVPQPFAKDIQYNAVLGVSEAVCVGCMAELLNRIQASYASGTTTDFNIASCRDDPLGTVCVSSGTSMATWLTNYEKCSGVSIFFNSGDSAIAWMNNILASVGGNFGSIQTSVVRAQSTATASISTVKEWSDKAAEFAETARSYVSETAAHYLAAFAKTSEAAELSDTKIQHSSSCPHGDN